MKGKLIVFEGTDGSGKATQTKLLVEALEQRGRAVRKLTFPRYDQDSSMLVRMYLNGAFGTDPNDVNPYAASTFYAVDRYASYKKVWGTDYEGGGLILADRYTTSNAVHQTGKLPEEEWEGFLRWLFDFEYHKLGLPEPDLVFYLDMPTERAAELLRRREGETHTTGDIHEVDTAYLAQCRRVALRAAELCGWVRISCVDGAGAIRTEEEIHEEIWTKIQSVL